MLCDNNDIYLGIFRLTTHLSWSAWTWWENLLKPKMATCTCVSWWTTTLNGQKSTPYPTKVHRWSPSASWNSFIGLAHRNASWPIRAVSLWMRLVNFGLVYKPALLFMVRKLYVLLYAIQNTSVVKLYSSCFSTAQLKHLHIFKCGEESVRSVPSTDKWSCGKVEWNNSEVKL